MNAATAKKTAAGTTIAGARPPGSTKATLAIEILVGVDDSEGK
jgi:hypothetical protein